MPAIVAFGRKWLVGSDDFVFPGLLDLTVKTCWLIAALIVFLRNDPNFGCPDGDHFKIYLYGLLAMLLMLILADALVVKNSMAGGILDEDARARVVPFIYIRCFFELLDIFWNILGTAWAYGDPFMLGCPEEPQALSFMKRFTVCNWISILIMFLFFVALYDPLGYDVSEQRPFDKGDCPLWENVGEQQQQGLPHSERALYWSAKLKKLTCFCCSPSKDPGVLGAFEEAGRIMNYMFRDSNYVTTDVAAGLLALYVRTLNEEELKKDRMRQHNSSQFPQGPLTCICRNNVLYPITSQPKPHQDSPDILASKQEIVLLDHYIRFIHGCYGWKAFLLKNVKKSGMSRLWKSVECCACWRNSADEMRMIKGDNCCLCSTAALRQTARVEENDIVYISFKNSYFEPPFYVAVDHSTKSLIVAIRGTLSTKNMLTNFTAWPSPMEIPGLPLHFKAHHGIMLTARKIKSKLEKDKVLERLQQKYPQYRLILVGQSFGGAVGTLLGMMLYYEFPSLHVFCFSPPGNVLNKDAAEFSKSFVTSVTYGDDVMARISISSISRFKNKLAQAVQSCQTPKYRLILGYRFLLSKKLPKFEYLEQVPPGEGLDEENNDTLSKDHVSVRMASSEVRNHQHHNNPFFTPMYIPGRILHITQRDSWLESPESGPRWQLRWAESKEFADIVISPRMILDHWYHRMEKGLHEFVIANCKDAFNAIHQQH